jgi:hypothetical protein
MLKTKSERLCKDWIETFCEYVSNTEVPEKFAKWAAISVIAAAMRRRCWLAAGRLSIFPNLYILLVSPPGSEKSAVIPYAINILTKAIPNIAVAPEGCTKKTFLREIRNAVTTFILPNNISVRYSALTVMSSDFNIFLQSKKLIPILVSMYDNPRGVWSHRNTYIINPCINIISCISPTSLASLIPLKKGIGESFISKTLFVYNDTKDKLVAIPHFTEKEKEYEQSLIHDLGIIEKLSIVYRFSEECEEKYSKWYVKQAKSPRICKDSILDGWYERKPLFVQKLAMICQASKIDYYIIEWDVLERAISLIEELEETMALAIRGFNRNDISRDMEMVYTLIKAKQYITDKELLSFVWRDMDIDKLGKVIPALHREGLIKILPQTPDGRSEICYVAVETKKGVAGKGEESCHALGV